MPQIPNVEHSTKCKRLSRRAVERVEVGEFFCPVDNTYSVTDTTGRPPLTFNQLSKIYCLKTSLG